MCKIYSQTFFEIFDFGIDFFQLHSTGSMFSPFMEPEVVQFGIGPKLNKWGFSETSVFSDLDCLRQARGKRNKKNQLSNYKIRHSPHISPM